MSFKVIYSDFYLEAMTEKNNISGLISQEEKRVCE